MRSHDSAIETSWRWHNVPLPEPHLLGIGVAVVMHRVRPWALPGPRILHRAAGVALVAVGAGVAVRSVRVAGRVDVAHPDQLLTTGPYAASRNPMYEAWLLIHLGFAVMGGTGWTMLTVPVAAGLVHRTILGEERRLAATFGVEFTRYRSAIPRYRLPGATTQI